MNQADQQAKVAMQATIDHLKQELKSLRTGRAHSSMLDKVYVELYGSSVRIKETASVTVPEARQILVTPFDPSTVHAIAKGIEAANLGIHPVVDGKVIRLNVPQMDETVRKNMVKQCKELGEKAKIGLRDVRRKVNDLVRKQKAEGDLSEDQMKRFEKQIQELTDRFCKDVDLLTQEKEKEMMTV